MIELKDCDASWIGQDTLTLKDLNLIVKPGSLCCVVGNVGAGKSSLLHLLLKEMQCRKERPKSTEVCLMLARNPGCSARLLKITYSLVNLTPRTGNYLLHAFISFICMFVWAPF
nr:unnamed protein product [Callosobruchus analis]